MKLFEKGDVTLKMYSEYLQNVCEIVNTFLKKKPFPMYGIWNITLVYQYVKLNITIFRCKNYTRTYVIFFFF